MNTIPKSKIHVKSLPQGPGVYFFKKDRQIIYIGKANNLKSRVSSYFLNSVVGKTLQMVKAANKISYILVNSEFEALLLEAKLVRKNKPKYNIELRDDKHPLYILITNDEFPRVLTARKIDENSACKAFFGPFPSSTNVRLVLRFLRNIFPYSEHKLGKKPCLYSQIGLCSPCPNAIFYCTDQKAKEKLEKTYKQNIKKIKSILDGNIKGVIKTLKKRMIELSNDEKYEEASVIRNKLEALEYITSPKVSITNYIQDPNFIDQVRMKETHSLLSILYKNGVNIKSLRRIECYDVAHLAGTATTASMVTFIDAEADKNFYRHFRIRQKNLRSDTDSLREVVKRRAKHFDDWGKPDLIVVDGGKPQAAVFFQELKKYSIPVVGLAKRYETLIFPHEKTGKIGFNEQIVPKSPAKNLLQRMRDEAHRFARRYHHKLISRSILEAKSTH